jgi:hypothetical protein
MKLAIDYNTSNKFAMEVVSQGLVDDRVRPMLQDVRIGLECNKIPGKTDILDSTGGVYFMRSSRGVNVAVFKPRDEEQGMENNPKGYSTHAGEVGSLRPYFKPGHGCLRELAAYVFDIDHFCGVPPTTLVHCEHPVFNYPKQKNGTSGKTFPKFGSLQMFVNGESFEDLGPSKLSDFEVQKIALFDLRILNCDRNSGNILAVRKLASESNSRSNSDIGLLDSCMTDDEFDIMDTQLNVYGGVEFELVPIDHGYAFPPKLRISEADWSWFYYPQVKKEVVPEIRDYIDKLDIDAVLLKLAEFVAEIPEETIFLVRLSHLLCKEGIAAGLTLRDIASMVARIDEDEPSKLEQAITMADDNAYSNIQNKSGRLNVNGSGKRLGSFALAPPPIKRPSIHSLKAVEDRTRSDSSESSESESEAGVEDGLRLQRMASIFSADEFANTSPVSSVGLSRELSGDLSPAVFGAVNDRTNPASVTGEKRTQGSKFARVASFAGFENNSLSDVGRLTSGDISSLQRERRKLVSNTLEFKQLRWRLASDAVRAMISRAKKAT